MPAVKTPLDFNASPQTGVGDGAGTAYQVWSKDKNFNGRVTVQAAGTWSGVTLKFEICLDGSVSPRVWSTAQALDPSAGTLTDAAMTADGTIQLEVQEGAWIRPIISGTGSPLPALKVDLLGEFDNQ